MPIERGQNLQPASSPPGPQAEEVSEAEQTPVHSASGDEISQLQGAAPKRQLQRSGELSTVLPVDIEKMQSPEPLTDVNMSGVQRGFLSSS